MGWFEMTLENQLQDRFWRMSAATVLGFIRGVPPRNPEFIYKNLYIYSYIFKLQSLSKYSPCDAMYLSRRFFHCSTQFLNLTVLRPFSASAIFCFTFSTSAKCFPLRTFSSGEIKQNKVTQVNRERGAQGSGYFWSKTAGRSAGCGQVHS